MEKKDANINWQVSATIECPYCEHYNDFMSMDEWYLRCDVAETKTFGRPLDWECSNCKKEFKVTESIY